MASIPLSIQLYTLRDQTARDFAGTLKSLADIGYKGVELAGYGNLKSADEVKAAVSAAGLVISGAHEGIDGLASDPEKKIAEHKTLGNQHVIVPWAPLEGKDEEGYKEFAAKLQSVGEAVTKAGLTLLYHNHSFEHKPLKKGLDGLDVIYQNTSPDVVKAELDLFWTQHGGYNPAAYLKKFGSRCLMVHLKDMEVGPDRRFANVGEGIIDFHSIINVGRELNLRWYVVEQDNCYGQDPLEAARNSFNTLRKWGYV